MALSAEMESKIKKLVQKEVSRLVGSPDKDDSKESQSVLFIFEVERRDLNGSHTRREDLMYFGPGTCPSRFLVEKNFREECVQANPDDVLQNFGAKNISVLDAITLRPDKIYNFKVTAVDYDDNNGNWGTRIKLV